MNQYAESKASYISTKKPEVDKNTMSFWMKRKVKLAWFVCFYVTLELRQNEKEFPWKSFDAELVSGTQENNTNRLRVLFAFISFEYFMLLTFILREKFYFHNVKH